MNEQFPNIKLAAETKKELAISAWEVSGSFATTHLRVQALSAFADFTAEQANRILRAALDNDQIRLILGDADVRAFVSQLLRTHARELDPELAKAVTDRVVVLDVLTA